MSTYNFYFNKIYIFLNFYGRIKINKIHYITIIKIIFNITVEYNDFIFFRGSKKYFKLTFINFNNLWIYLRERFFFI